MNTRGLGDNARVVLAKYDLLASDEMRGSREHDDKIILDLEAMASNTAAGFWPQALAIGALRLIRQRDICPMCAKQIDAQEDVIDSLRAADSQPTAYRAQGDDCGDERVIAEAEADLAIHAKTDPKDYSRELVDILAHDLRAVLRTRVAPITQLVALIDDWRKAAADPATYHSHSEILTICANDLQAAMEETWALQEQSRTPVSYRYHNPNSGQWSQWFDMSFANEDYKKAIDWKWPMQFSYPTEPVPLAPPIAQWEGGKPLASPGSSEDLMDLGNALVACAGLLDTIKFEWAATNDWSPWDERVRASITYHLAKIEGGENGPYHDHMQAAAESIGAHIPTAAPVPAEPCGCGTPALIHVRGEKGCKHAVPADEGEKKT